MPASKSRHSRHAHQQHHRHPHQANVKKNTSASIIAILFFALLGTGITYFIAGSSIPSILTGAIVGGIAGYLFGHQIDNTIKKK
jgi:hypothetical protein